MLHLHTPVFYLNHFVHLDISIIIIIIAILQVVQLCLHHLDFKI